MNRLRPRPRRVLLVVHVIASVALLGEVWALVVLNVSTTLTTTPGLPPAAYRTMQPLVAAGGIPLSMTALISGVVLSLGTHWGLVRHLWVFAKLLLLVATILIGIFLFDPEELAVLTRHMAPEVTVRQWFQVAALGAQVTLLVTATALSVFKPKGRLPWLRSARRPGGKGDGRGRGAWQTVS